MESSRTSSTDTEYSSSVKRKFDTADSNTLANIKVLKVNTLCSTSNVAPPLENGFSGKPSSSSFSSNTERNTRTLDSLPEYVLLEVFKFLSLTDLCNLSVCNRKLRWICINQKFSQDIHDVCDGVSPDHIRLLPIFNDSTTSLHLSNTSKSSSKICFQNDFFKSLKYVPNLETFVLENHCIIAATFDLKYLPKNITELRLKKHFFIGPVKHTNQIFNNIHTILPNLEILDLSHCSWVQSELLYTLSNCSKLKTLIMVGCYNLRNIALDARIGAEFGFPKLETLDLRLTDVDEDEFCCFTWWKKLKHILLERTVSKCQFHYHYTVMSNHHNPSQYSSYRTNNFADFFGGSLETLAVRNYFDITDVTLEKIEERFKSLKQLDITGTNCSAKQVAIFRRRRPEVKVLHT